MSLAKIVNMKGLKHFLNNLMSICDAAGFTQKRCIHCLRPFYVSEQPGLEFAATDRLCDQCQSAIAEYAGERCIRCGFPIDLQNNAPLQIMGATHTFICPDCQKQKPSWDHVAYFGIYAGNLRDLILRLKFDRQLYLVDLLADLLLEASKCLPKPDLLLAIPQYSTHLRRRGFNQAHELCKALSKLTGVRTNGDILRKIKETLPQEGLDAYQRRLNLKGAFQASAQVRNLNIWLIDDVMTTGSTLNAAAIALRAAGAKNISVLCVARTALD